MERLFQLFCRKAEKTFNENLNLVYRIVKETFSVDLRSLALLRMGLGAIIMGDLFIRSLDLQMFYTDAGVMPRSVLLEKFLNPARFSLYLIDGSTWFGVVLFCLAFLFAFFLFIGYKTRLSTTASLILLISLHARNTLVLNGGDHLLRLLLLWSLLLPLGAKYSLDNAFNKLRDSIPKKKFSAGVAGLFLQVAMVYWFAVSFKLLGNSWKTGQAIYYTLSLDHLSTHFALFLLGFPAVLIFLNYGVFFIQIIGPLLLLSPIYQSFFRTLGVVLFILFHLGIAFTLRLGTFPFVGILSVLPFLPSGFWDYFDRKKSEKITEPLRLYYDNECGFCQKMILILKTFLLFRNVEMSPAQGTEYSADMEKHNSWIVVDDSGNIFTHFAALAKASKSSIILKPISGTLQSKPVGYLGKKLYVLVSNNRSFFAKFLTFLKPHEYMPRGSMLGNGVAVLLIAYIFILNIITTRPNYIAPRAFMLPAYFLYIDQKWSFFAPELPKKDGWYVIPGKLKNGKEVDLFQKQEIVRWEKPEFVPSTYKTMRWRRYMMNLLIVNKEAKNNFAKYLCREWNRKHERDEEKLETLEIYFMNETTLPDYKKPEIKKELLWRHNCFKVPATKK